MRSYHISALRQVVQHVVLSTNYLLIGVRVKTVFSALQIENISFLISVVSCSSQIRFKSSAAEARLYHDLASKLPDLLCSNPKSAVPQMFSPSVHKPFPLIIPSFSPFLDTSHLYLMINNST